MIKINLVSAGPEAAATKKASPEISMGGRQGDIILLAALFICLVITGGRWWMLHSEKTHLDQVKAEKTAERNALQKYIDKVEELEAKRAELQAKIDTIKQLKENQKGPVRVLDEISKTMPDLVWLTDFNLAGNQIKMNGMALDENAIANYVDNLDLSPLFGEPNVEIIKRQQNDDAFSFRLECEFTYRPAEIEAVEDGEAGS